MEFQIRFANELGVKLQFSHIKWWLSSFNSNLKFQWFTIKRFFIKNLIWCGSNCEKNDLVQDSSSSVVFNIITFHLFKLTRNTNRNSILKQCLILLIHSVVNHLKIEIEFILNCSRAILLTRFSKRGGKLMSTVETR